MARSKSKRGKKKRISRRSQRVRSDDIAKFRSKLLHAPGVKLESLSLWDRLKKSEERRINEHKRRLRDVSKGLRSRERNRFERFMRNEKEAALRRITPDFYARAKEIRNFLQSREKWICTKRRSRREGLFGSGSIGKNKVVSKLRRMTIESIVDCKRV